MYISNHQQGKQTINNHRETIANKRNKQTCQTDEGDVPGWCHWGTAVLDGTFELGLQGIQKADSNWNPHTRAPGSFQSPRATQPTLEIKATHTPNETELKNGGQIEWKQIFRTITHTLNEFALEMLHLTALEMLHLTALEMLHLTACPLEN